jgi:hypothetical protein
VAIAVREPLSDDADKVMDDNSRQSIAQLPLPLAISVLKPDSTIVTLLPCERNGEELEMFTDERSRIIVESLTKTEFEVVEPTTLTGPLIDSEAWPSHERKLFEIERLSCAILHSAIEKSRDARANDWKFRQFSNISIPSKLR